jgi:hypothetical protein
MTRRRDPWLGLGWSAWSLGVEAASVIGLRAMKIAQGGPAAAAETRRMVAEKVDAGLALQTLALTGGLGFTPQRAAAKTLTHYRRKVRANHRRLQRE